MRWCYRPGDTGEPNDVLSGVVLLVLLEDEPGIRAPFHGIEDVP